MQIALGQINCQESVATDPNTPLRPSADVMKTSHINGFSQFEKVLMV